MLRFECCRCGECCTHLINPVKGLPVTNGLLLLETEKDLFPTDLVKPQWGIGGEGTEPECIVTYQVAVDVCPAYDDGGCRIYGKRPLMCRAFPMTYQRGGFAWSDSCSWIQKHRLTPGGISGVIAPREIESARTLYSLLSTEAQIACVPMLYWNFDLRTSKWILLGPAPVTTTQRASSTLDSN